MKIGELARQAGVKASAIRYYESVRLLAEPLRSGGQRRYAAEAVERVLLIRFAGEMGFTLAEIRLFLSGLRDTAPVGARWRKLALRKIREVETVMEHSRRWKVLLEHLVQCRCGSLGICVEKLRLSPRRQAFQLPGRGPFKRKQRR
jgi:MerR family redox-sensitive transcriptional activator SoxR